MYNICRKSLGLIRTENTSALTDHACASWKRGDLKEQQWLLSERTRKQLDPRRRRHVGHRMRLIQSRWYQGHP